MTEPAGLQRARADIDAGRLWKARDRLGGLLVTNGTDSRVLELLGEVHFRMGDLPAAGRAWYLTTRTGDDVDAATAAMLEHHGTNAGALLGSLPVKAPVAAYPPDVQLRLQSLLDAVPRDGRRVHGVPHVIDDRRGSPAGLAWALGIIVVLAIVGLVTIVAATLRAVL